MSGIPGDMVPVEYDPTVDTTTTHTLTQKLTKPVKRAVKKAVKKSPEPVQAAVEVVAERTKVVSAPGKVDWRDRTFAWCVSFCLTTFGVLGHLWDLIAQILDSVADYVLPYLQNISQGNKSMIVAAVTFVAMGLLILHKRKTVGPSYMPPLSTSYQPWTASAPVPQVQPLPPGSPVDMSQSAF